MSQDLEGMEGSLGLQSISVQITIVIKKLEKRLRKERVTKQSMGRVIGSVYEDEKL